MAKKQVGPWQFFVIFMQIVGITKLLHSRANLFARKLLMMSRQCCLQCREVASSYRGVLAVVAEERVKEAQYWCKNNEIYSSGTTAPMVHTWRRTKLQTWFKMPPPPACVFYRYS
ncbi:unnamed protein product [Umbelopsis ramanniana]